MGVWIAGGLCLAAALAALALFRAKRPPQAPGAPVARKDEQIKVPGLFFKEPLKDRSSRRPEAFLKEALQPAHETATVEK